jgi:uncharacterized membrane protein
VPDFNGSCLNDREYFIRFVLRFLSLLCCIDWKLHGTGMGKEMIDPLFDVGFWIIVFGLTGILFAIAISQIDEGN